MQHKETSSYIPLVVAGLLGASAGSVIMSRTSAKEEPRPAAAIRGPRVSDTTEGPPEAIWLGRVRPALELVADHLGIPRRPRESERQKALLAAYWRAVAESGDPKSASAARKAAAELGKEDPKIRSTLTPAIGPVSAAPLEKDTLLWRERADFVERNLEERRAAELRDEVFERLWPEPKEGTPPPAGPTLEVVIATLPDYVDSYSAWTFDQLIDVLQRAAGASGLVIDRFYLPDWQPEAAEAPRAGAARSTVPRHEIEPAAVLFRHTSGNLVLLLLPLETATSGIHKAAFVGALGLAQAVSKKSPSGGGVTVLGPTFSGSTPSLALALEYAFEEGILSCEGPRPIVQFISGSATDQANRQGLQGVSACGGAAVSFQATVVNDGQALRALRSFLGSVNKAWESGQHMAILTESNSGWGQALPTGFDTPEDIGPEACQRVISDAELAASSDPFPCAKRLTFPLHISRLRTQAARAPGGGTALPGETVASFRNEDKILPTDQLPALRPELSAAMVETALATTFGALDRLDITAIGLIGSDARDLLFLAEQIRRRRPNVLLFTLEGSLAFLHPDYRPYARGMILASSYPLHSMTQQLLPAPSGDVPIQQFPSMGAQGLYNAFLATMGNPHRMLDYGTSCGAFASFATCRPSIWVSQVGNNAIWPLRRSETVDDGYTWRPEPKGEEVVSPPDPSSAVRAKATWPIAAGVGLVATAILGLMHTLFLWRALAPTPTAAARVGVGLFETPREAWKRWGLPADDDDRLSRLREEHGMGLLACWGALLVPVFLGTHLASVGMNTGQGGPSPGWLGAAAGLRWILLAAFGAAAFTLLARSSWSYSLLGLWRLVRLAGVVLGLMALFALSQSLREPEVWRVPLAGSTAQRYLMLKSLLSPVTPLLLLSVAVYGWGLWNLWRLHHQIAPHGRDCAVVALLQGESRETADRFEAVLDEPSLEVRGSEALAILVIVAIQLTAAWNHFVTTDGVLMSDALLAGTLLATLLAAHVLAYCHGTGRTLLGALAALNRHPIGSSFARVGREPFLWRLSDGAPTLDQAAPLFRLAEVNARSFSQLLGRLQARARQHQEAGRIYVGDEHRAHRLASGATKYEVAVEGERAAQIEELQIRGVDIERLEETRKRLEQAAPEGDRRPLQASSLWREVASWSQPLVLAMRKVWRRDPYGLTALAMGDEGSEGGPRHLREAETLLALQASYSIRQVVIRLTRGLAFGVSALVLVLFAHLSYLFQGRAFWLGLDWALLGVASLLGLSLFVRMEKDVVLSRLWGTPPGHLSLNGQFVQRIVMYVAIPVVTLFVTFFPEVGQALFSWLEPLQKSLP